MSHFKISAILFASLTLAACVGASEVDELRGRARAMQRRAAELAEHGNREEAEIFERKSVAMLEEAEHSEHRQPDHRDLEIVKMKERLEMLRMNERKLEATSGNEDRLVDVRREAEKVERELKEMSHHPSREQPDPHEEIARKLEHMRIAVEHLHHAGLHDVAESVAERAHATERELHEQHRQNDGTPIHEIMNQLDEIRHEVARLRGEMNELQNAAK